MVAQRATVRAMTPVVPKSAQELFDVLIPEGLRRFPDKAREIGSVYGFKIAGDGGGEWTVDLTANPPTCQKGDGGNAQCTFAIEHEDFKAMLADPSKAMEMYFNQKLQITGDVMLSMRLQQMLTELLVQP